MSLFWQKSSPSKLNILVRVPMTPSTVTRKSFSGPSPAASRQTTEEAEAHDAVTQPVKPTRIDGVTSREPKLIPDTVKLYPAVAAALSSAAKLTEGAAQFLNPREARHARKASKKSHVRLYAAATSLYNIEFTHDTNLLTNRRS
jgi:hypothetical protein